MRRFRPAALVLTVLVGSLPMLPAEHAHESDADGDHHVLVHRHAEAHLPGLDPRHHDEHGRLLDHDDDHTVTLSSVFTASSPYWSAPPVRLVVGLLPSPPMTVAAGPAVYVERVIHGPPRAPTGLRAPPRSSRL